MKKFKCCFCGQEFEGFGNNPYPASKKEDDRCCDDCNALVVIPARLFGMHADKSNETDKK